MKPLLASLVLLLLALCRPASTAVSWTSVASATSSTKSSMSFVPAAERSSVQQGMSAPISEKTKKGVTPEQIANLVNAMGNTPYFFVMASLISRVPYLSHPLLNGVTCDPDEPGFKDNLNKAFYAVETRAEEEEELGCGKPEPTKAEDLAFWKCVCKDANSALFCLALAIKKQVKTDAPNFQSTLCLSKAQDALRAAGTGALGKLYDLDGFEKRNFANEFGGKDVGAVTNNEDAEMAKVFCDATNDKVEDAVKVLYKASALYWIAESMLYSIVFGPPTKPLPEECAEPLFQDNDYGKCVCKMDTGFSFCVYKVLGKAFRDAGYLECTDDTPTTKKEFVVAKKPAALPVLAKAKPSSSATASSLLMVPLVAAAALFARH